MPAVLCSLALSALYVTFWTSLGFNHSSYPFLLLLKVLTSPWEEARHHWHGACSSSSCLCPVSSAWVKWWLPGHLMAAWAIGFSVRSPVQRSVLGTIKAHAYWTWIWFYCLHKQNQIETKTSSILPGCDVVTICMAHLKQERWGHFLFGHLCKKHV